MVSMVRSSTETGGAGSRSWHAWIWVLAVGLAGCGGTPPAPEVSYLSVRTHPGWEGPPGRIDMVADVVNPLSEALLGVHLEVTMPDGLRVVLELGDIPAGAAGTSWKRVRREAMPRPGDLAGAPTETLGEGAPLELELAREVTRVVLGYQVGGERVSREVTAAVNDALPGWIERDRAAARATGGPPQAPMK